ncbi:peptidoglycan DD-metalloendopeptidase family protein [Vibrio fluvialis]|uniref:peptidoglycan DD-metalloendopeptidase family protein n=1 Tax=Vibrio fluvialis TaxID=676 RepID=UPI001EEB75A8|nr:peptidoglycan DD-metalloendopeptidase family protein [Vibrio fluvialis]MCG6403248.1 peptidoglycan DD-metalloendopeptidase family protein [Vibrio fluvialis]
MKKYILTTITILLFFIFYNLNLDKEKISNPLYDITIEHNKKNELETNPNPPPDFEIKKHVKINYNVKSGDTLSDIFDKFNISNKYLVELLDSDQSHLALDIIKPDVALTIYLAEHNSLEKLELILDGDQQITYLKNSAGTFSYSKLQLPSKWETNTYIVNITSTFSQAAKDAGLSIEESYYVYHILKNKIDFSKDIHLGDIIEVIDKKQYIENHETGNHVIQAVKYISGNKVISAYLDENGQYYDESGNSIQNAFLRYPSKRKWRISSNFNPNRHHPVTGKWAPHYGTDIAAPTGTPVLATADGVVIMTRNHPYAGLYVVVKHDSVYTTRYLHLSKLLVHKGQRVTRGETIALSGATGLVTGPHIHYELIKNGHPVNAMTAKIPMYHALPKDMLRAFMVQRDELNTLLEHQEAEFRQVATLNSTDSLS